MKVSFYISLAVLSIITAAFGVLLFSHSVMDSHAGCLAQVLNRTDCPATLGAFRFFAAHMDAFRKISLAVLTSGFFGLLLVPLLFVAQDRRLQKRHSIPLFQTARAFPDIFYLSRRSILSWIARHEKRDPAFLFRL
ncbi:MAG: hypothetical protein AAB631_02975 [Patescibacteria group bacterium]